MIHKCSVPASYTNLNLEFELSVTQRMHLQGSASHWLAKCAGALIQYIWLQTHTERQAQCRSVLRFPVRKSVPQSLHDWIKAAPAGVASSGVTRPITRPTWCLCKWTIAASKQFVGWTRWWFHISLFQNMLQKQLRDRTGGFWEMDKCNRWL